MKGLGGSFKRSQKGLSRYGLKIPRLSPGRGKPMKPLVLEVPTSYSGRELSRCDQEHTEEVHLGIILHHMLFYTPQ